MRATIVASVLFAASFAPLHAAEAPAPQNPAAATRSDPATTLQFAQKTWSLNTFEIQAGRAVESRVKDYVVREYALAIQRDHARMSDDLAAIAGRADIKLPTALDSEQVAKLRALDTATGQQLERNFRDQQVDGHREAVRLFQSYADNRDNAELKSWAKASLETLQEHLDRAQALREPPGTM